MVVALRVRFRRSVRDGDLPEVTDCVARARYVATVLHGLAVQAANGADAKELEGVLDLALRAWPA